MRELFEPKSVAIIGASRDKTKWGGRVLNNLIRYEFGGSITPVNPSADEVMGLPAVRSIARLPEGVDLAVIALPSSAVPEAVWELGARGVRMALILTSGFAELGREGQSAQEEMVAAARSSGLRLIGPNALGVINTATGLVAAATSAVEVGVLPRGGLSIVSQSGAVGLGTVLTRAVDRGRGLAKLVSTGNESDVTCAELLDYLAEDDETDAVGLFIEGTNDGRSLINSVRTARSAGKPVAILKVGRTDAGASAAATHTGLLAGVAGVFRGSVDGAGATWCHDVEDLLDKTSIRPEILPVDSLPRMAIMSSSGGINTLGADLLTDSGVPLASLSDDTRMVLRDLLPEFNPIGNPLDVSGHVAGRAEIQLECLRALCADEGVDGVVVILTFLPAYVGLTQLLRKDSLSGKLIVFVNTGGAINSEASLMLQHDLGYPVFASLASCASAIRDAARAKRWVRRHGDDPELKSTRSRLPEGADDGALFGWLEDEGISCVPFAVVDSEEDAVDQAQHLGFPVVVKAMSSEIMHKSDIGAVELHIESDDGVRAAFSRIRQLLRAAGLEGDRLVIQKNVDDALELIVGGKLDDQFGPIILVGHGGVLANVLNQSVIRTAPLSTTAAEEMLADLPAGEIIHGHRAMSKRDVGAIQELIVRCSELVAAIAQSGVAFDLDLNPVLVLADGAGAQVADAVLVSGE